MTVTIPTMLDEALAYAARGWRVIALHTPQPDGSCSCGKSTCDSIGKHPRWDAQLLPSGLKSATTDPGIIQVWWSLWPDANIGITTGAGSDFWALDIDPRHGGDLSLEQLIAQHGTLPETIEASTGSGGSHLLFSRPAVGIRNRASFAPGLDTRGDGGYIVVAPSLHASGQRYQWRVSPDDAPLADAPQWLLDLVIRQSAAQQTAQQSIGNTGQVPLQALPKRTLHYLAFGASNGTRNAELYAAAQQFYAAGYSQAEAEQHLHRRAQIDGLDDAEIDRTIASAYQSVQVNSPAAAPGGPQTPPTGASSTAASATSSPAQQKHQHSVFIAAALAAMGYTFRLNLCNDTVEVNGEPITDVVAARIRMDARDTGLRPLSAVSDTYTIEAAKHAYHPIRDYLTSLVWDGQYRITQLAACLRGTDPLVTAPDGRQHSLIHIYLWRWMIGAVAKAVAGEQNLMLVLVSARQGIGKSQFARWLCPLPTYFIEAPLDVSDKDTLVRLMHTWIWEVSELDASTRRADVSALKDIITKRNVTVRKSYGQYDTTKPALASFLGTVNDSTGFLTDDTGNRRFLVATIDFIDWSYQQLDRDQLWAEAVAAYQAGEPWQPLPHERTAQEEQNKLHEIESLWDGWISNYFVVGAAAGSYRMTASDIIDWLRTRYDIRPSGGARSQAMEIARVLKRLGARQARTGTWRGYEGVMPR